MADGGDDGAASGPLIVRVLGPTALERSGEALAIGGKRQRAVLARLALAEGRLVTVDRLVEDLWGDDAQSSILTTLHGYVSRLRSALQEPARLRREGPGYVLDVTADEVDARRFEALVTEARHTVDADPAAALAALDAALAQWRGPAFADVAEMEWAHAAATRLSELRVAAMELRFDALLDLGRHTSAVAEIESVLHENPLRERFAAQLAVALYRAGRQSDALRAIDRTRRVLLDELGLDLSPELVKVESAILAHDEWLAAPAVVVATPAATRTVAAEATEPAPRPASPVALPPAAVRHGRRPFVGRVDALRELRAAWSESLAGRRRFVVIEGEAGGGKSRLAAKFAAEANADGAIVLWGRATSEAIVPYEPLVEALRTVLRTISPEARHRVVDGRKGLATLLPFVPGLADVEPASGREFGSDRYVLFETVAELLDAESAMHPMVLVLDDLQWADGLSMRLLQHLMQHERSARLLVVATVRTIPVTANPDLDALQAELRRDGLLRCITLTGLSESEVAELLVAHGDRIPSTQAAAVLRTTGGNPFFVTELAEHGDSSTLPASVRDALGARLARLSPGATRLLAMAAVAGANASLPVLARATGLEGDEFLDAVDVTIDEGLLGEEETTGSLIFRHAIVRQVVLERFSYTRRSTMHLTISDALEAIGSTKMQLAHHLLEAGGLAAAERRVDAATGAGREALAVLAYEDGVQWAQRALAIVPAGTDPRCRCEALLLLSEAQRALGDRLAARDAANSAAAEARMTGDPVLLARAAEAVALARSGLGFDFGTEDSSLHELLGEALRNLPASELGHRTKLLEASMSNAAANSDLVALRGLSREAISLAEAVGQPGLVATAHLASRMSNWQVHLLDERIEADRGALEAALRAPNNTHLQMNALLYGISDLTEAGLVDEADMWLDDLRIRAAALRQPVYDAFVGFFDATVALLRGEYELSAKLADEALLRGSLSHGSNAENAWAAQAFIRAWDQGQLPTLIDTVAQAASKKGTLPVWRIGYGACLAAAGRSGEAQEILADFVTDAGIRHNPDSVWLAVGGLLVEIARAVGDRLRAAILLREMRPYEGRIVLTGLGRASLGPVNRFLGVAAHLTGDLDEAERFLRASAKQARWMFAVPHQARALFDLSSVLIERDGSASEEAAALREKAEGLARPIGLVLGGLGAVPAR